MEPLSVAAANGHGTCCERAESPLVWKRKCTSKFSTAGKQPPAHGWQDRLPMSPQHRSRDGGHLPGLQALAVALRGRRRGRVS